MDGGVKNTEKFASLHNIHRVWSMMSCHPSKDVSKRLEIITDSMDCRCPVKEPNRNELPCALLFLPLLSSCPIGQVISDMNSIEVGCKLSASVPGILRIMFEWLVNIVTVWFVDFLILELDERFHIACGG